MEKPHFISERHGVVKTKCSPGLEGLAAKNSPKGQGKGGEKGSEKQEQDSRTIH